MQYAFRFGLGFAAWLAAMLFGTVLDGPFGLTGSNWGSCVSAAPPQEDPIALLPDVFPWASESRGYLYDWEVDGNLLRFSTAFANQGEGHLELRGGAVLPNGNQEVYQRVFYDDGTYQDRLAGEFTYHAGHGHIHFDGYAIYSLREYLSGGGVGDVVATGGKISFCLIDITRYLPNAGSSRYNSCGQVQGVSAGWSDVYSRNLPDQWINISLVPDGQYWLEVTIDPDHLLLESNPDNNVARIPVELNRGGTAGGDRWEPNNSFSQATPLGEVSEFRDIDLTLHNAADEDVFSFVPEVHGDFDVHINFTHALGNLDLYVYDQSQNLVGSSTSLLDNEELHFHGHAGQPYYLVIRSDEGATNGYELDFHGPGVLAGEVLDSADVPVNIPDGVGASNPGAWVSSTLVGPEMLITDVNLILDQLDHTWLGDLEIELISPQGTVARVFPSQWQSGGGLLTSQDNFLRTRMDDQASLNLAQGTSPYTGWFRIDHANTGSNPLSVFNGENADGIWTVRARDWYSGDTGVLRAWSLMLTGEPINPGDRFEPNNSFPQAVDLGLLGQTTVAQIDIHNADDQDFFRFLAGAPSQSEIRILFSHQAGNLDLVVYDASLNEIARGDSTSDNEVLNVPLQAGDLYYVEILGVAGARNAYQLELDVAPQIGETGTLPAVDDQWQLLEFDLPYIDPIVIAGPASVDQGVAGTVQVRNVTGQGCEVRFGRWDDSDPTGEVVVVDYLVVEAGSHELPGGARIEAGSIGSVNHEWTYRGIRPFLSAPPVVLVQVASDQADRVATARLVRVTRKNFQVRVEEAESSLGTATGQQVHWVAISPTTSLDNPWQFQTGQARVSSQLSRVDFAAGFVEIPRIWSSLQSANESDPAAIRLFDLKANKAMLALEEDQTWDSETEHRVETVGWASATGQKIFARDDN